MNKKYEDMDEKVDEKEQREREREGGGDGGKRLRGIERERFLKEKEQVIARKVAPACNETIKRRVFKSEKVGRLCVYFFFLLFWRLSVGGRRGTNFRKKKVLKF